MEFLKLVGPFGVFSIMFALDLNLNIRRFFRLFSKPKNFVVGALVFSEIKYLVPITIYALLQYCFLLFYLGNMKIKNKF